MEKRKENILDVKMLGDFSVAYCGMPVSFGKAAFQKSGQLFQLLMLNHGSRLTKEQIMEYLYRNSVGNKNNNLNNVIYRLRNLMTEAGVPGEPYIALEDGCCVWKNEDVQVRVDALEFKDRIERSRTADPEQKIRLLWEAWFLYEGELLPRNSSEEWAIPYIFHYKMMYRECVNQLADWFWQQENYKELFQLYSRSVRIDFCDEWNLAMIEVLISAGDYEQAYLFYEKTVQTYEEVYGTVPVKIRERLYDISYNLNGNYESLRDIQQQVLENPRRWKNKDADFEDAGAYFCDFADFSEMYRFFQHLGKRVSIDICLMQLTLMNRDKMPLRRKMADSKSTLLKKAIHKALRNTDVFTQYDSGQFLILLNSAVPENGKVIFNRIMNVCEGLGGVNRRNVGCEIVSVTGNNASGVFMKIK